MATQTTDPDLQPLQMYLRELKERRGWTWQEFSDKTGVARSSLQRALGMYKGNAASVQIYIAIADVFGIPAENVLRMAGILDKELEQTTEVREITYIYSKLPREHQREVLNYLRWIYHRGDNLDAKPVVPKGD